MTKIELLEQIVKKQDELIEWLDSDLESGDALIRLQLSILKKQLEECEDNKTIEDRSHEIKWHGDEWDDLDDFNEPLNTPIKL